MKYANEKRSQKPEKKNPAACYDGKNGKEQKIEKTKVPNMEKAEIGDGQK